MGVTQSLSIEVHHIMNTAYEYTICEVHEYAISISVTHVSAHVHANLHVTQSLSIEVHHIMNTAHKYTIYEVHEYAIYISVTHVSAHVHANVRVTQSLSIIYEYMGWLRLVGSIKL